MALSSTMGRPRDPEVDRRILHGTLKHFARNGWSGFSIEGVSRASGVAKPSIYLRWSDKEQLLVDAISATMKPYELDTLSDFHTNLRALAMQMLDEYASENYVFMRISLDSSVPARIRDIAANLARARIAAGRAVIKHGIARGEIPATASPTIILDCITGAVVNHVFTTRFYQGAAPLKENRQYVDQLLRFLMPGILAGTEG